MGRRRSTLEASKCVSGKSDGVPSAQEEGGGLLGRLYAETKVIVRATHDARRPHRSIPTENVFRCCHVDVPAAGRPVQVDDTRSS